MNVVGNYNELYGFKNSLIHGSTYPTKVEFPANVTYITNGNTSASENLDGSIFISSENDSDISFSGGSKITSQNYHLGFSAKHQEFKYDPTSNTLTINGSSPKMNGPYTVVVKEI